MGGVLEKKKRNMMDDLERDPWMDEPQDTWTPEMHMEYKKFLQRVSPVSYTHLTLPTILLV
eukprot:3150623-Pyramimonas_sp.AAC.1